MLEGMVYNLSLQHINTVVTQALSNETAAILKLREQTAHWTGEWCLWIQKGSQLYIVNDPLARLPVYYYQTAAYFFAGRHLGLLAEAHLLEPDRLGVASFLWSGYYIGFRTPYQHVYRLPGGSLVELDLTTGDARVDFGAAFNFDARNTAHISEQAAQLAHLFRQACSRIADAWPGLINISQSGGQDSRAVAVGFAEMIKHNRLIASSFSMPGAERDALIAETIAAQLQIPFSVYTIEGSTSFEDELLENKMGMNYLAMAFIHDFYKKMLQKNSSFLYVTGDGGDKALPYLGEKNTNLSIDDLVMQLSRRHAMTPVGKVAGLLGMAADEIYQLIYQAVNNYPEQQINNKSIHFTVYERAGTCMYEGEDRTRYFAWATTPFYDLDFFRAAMLVPDVYKKHYTIYRPFQNSLSREIADIPDASGHSINNWKFIARKRVQESFRSAPPGIKNVIRKLGGVSGTLNNGTTLEREVLVQQLKNHQGLAGLLDAEAVAAFLPTAKQEQYEHLRTVILLNRFLKD
ncbi:MAG: hypothetical protein ABIX01_07955 [Chitinophagaceae bacterium]